MHAAKRDMIGASEYDRTAMRPSNLHLDGRIEGVQKILVFASLGASAFELH